MPVENISKYQETYKMADEYHFLKHLGTGKFTRKKLSRLKLLENYHGALLVRQNWDDGMDPLALEGRVKALLKLERERTIYFRTY